MDPRKQRVFVMSNYNRLLKYQKGREVLMLLFLPYSEFFLLSFIKMHGENDRNILVDARLKWQLASVSTTCNPNACKYSNKNKIYWIRKNVIPQFRIIYKNMPQIMYLCNSLHYSLLFLLEFRGYLDDAYLVMWLSKMHTNLALSPTL